MTTTRQPMRLPRQAAALRVPLWQRSNARLRVRWGFDLNASDVRGRVEELLAGGPEDPERVLLHAAVLATQGENDKAERETRRALELQPDLARAHTTLATLLIARSATEEGLKEARRAAELDGDDPTVLYNLGLAEWSAGEQKAAKAAFRKALEVVNGETGGQLGVPWWKRMRRRDGPTTHQDG